MSLSHTDDDAVALLVDTREPLGDQQPADLDNPLRDNASGHALRSWVAIGTGLNDTRDSPRARADTARCAKASARRLTSTPRSARRQQNPGSPGYQPLPYPMKLPAPGPPAEKRGSPLRLPKPHAKPKTPSRSSNGFVSLYGDEGLYHS